MSKNRNSSIAPIVKWVGGKHQLIPEIEKYIPQKYSTPVINSKSDKREKEYFFLFLKILKTEKILGGF